MAPTTHATARAVLLAALIGFGLAALAQPARAQRTSSLSWVRLAGAESCIATHRLAQRVEERIGRAVFVSASQADLSLEGHVERAPDGDAFVATLLVSDRSGRELGRRVLRAPGSDCSALEPALVLVIAIGLDPNATLPATQQPGGLSEDTQTLLSQLELPKTSEDALRELAVPDPEAVRPDPGEVEVAAPVRRKPGGARPEPRPGARASLDPAGTSAVLGITGDLGVLPDTALGGSLRIMFAIDGFWPVELALAGLLPSREPLAASSGVAEVAFAAAGLGLCSPSNSSRSLEFFACTGARVGFLRVHGDGFAQDRSATSPWVELGLQGASRIRFGATRSWLLQLTLAVGAPLIRDTFQYLDARDDVRQLYRPEPLVGRIELGTGVSF